MAPKNPAPARRDGNEAPVRDSHDSSDPTSDAPTAVAVDPAAQIDLSPSVGRNALGDPTVPDPGNNNAETVVTGTAPYTGSAAQLGDTNLADTDVQWPPGVVNTAGDDLARATPGTRGIDAPGRNDVEPNDADQ